MIAPTRNPEAKVAKWPFKPLKVPKRKPVKVIRSEALERHLAELEARKSDG